MGRRTVDPYSAGADLSRQNLTSVDVRFWRLKSWLKIFIMAVDQDHIGIQMNRIELTDTFMMILKWKKPFGLHGFYKKNSTF